MQSAHPRFTAHFRDTSCECCKGERGQAHGHAHEKHDGIPAGGLRFVAAFAGGALAVLGLHPSGFLGARSFEPSLWARGAVVLVVAGLIAALASRARSTRTRPEASRPEDAERRASTFAHEAKNALAAMRGLAKHMAKTADDAKSRERLAVLAQEATRVHELIEGFVGSSVPSKELVAASPSEVAREVATLLEGRTLVANQKIVVRGTDGPAYAHADALREALLNLYLNALDASPAGAIVEVLVEQSPSEMCLCVSDHGEGMTEATLRGLSLGRSFTTKPTGSGIGLSIVRSFVTAHGGRLTIESTLGTGSTFTMHLPRHV
jgi:signal transduction histidine kinase